MADAAARREARRRRILENSHNRLQLISGKINDESYRDSPRRTPIPDQNVDVPFITEVNTVNTCFLNNGVINTEMETLTTTNANEVNDIEVTNDLAAFISSSSTDTHTESSLVDNLLTYKYDVVVLSLLLQFLYGLSILTFEITFFFLPLILYTVSKIIFFPTQNNSNVANVLLLLNGFSAQKVKIIMNVMNLAMIFSRDVCVYLFTTICIQSLWYVMNLNSGLREVY